MSADHELLYRLGLALGIGLLVGVERHWREREAEAGQRTAGLRTFGIIGLLGGIVAALAAAFGRAGGGGGAVAAALLLGLCILGLSAALILFKLREAEAEESFSVTSVIVAQAVFVLGALAVLGDAAATGAAAVAMTALLASREVLHAFVRRLSWPELRSAILLLTMTLVALPLVPDRPIATLWGLNPARLWMLAVILAAVSFVGYVAVRLLGVAHGRLIAGAAAGLASSTAATMTNARLARTERAAPQPLVAGALAAGAVSYARTAALALFASPAMAAPLLPALLAGALAQGAAALLIGRQDGVQSAEPSRARLGNPFELGAVLRMAVLLAAVALLGERAAARFGDAGAVVVAAVTGLADVDAVTLSMAELVPGGVVSAALAALAVAVAVASNTVAKVAYGAVLGGLRFGAPFGVGSLAGLAAGAAALWLWPEGW